MAGSKLVPGLLVRTDAGPCRLVEGFRPGEVMCVPLEPLRLRRAVYGITPAALAAATPDPEDPVTAAWLAANAASEVSDGG